MDLRPGALVLAVTALTLPAGASAAYPGANGKLLFLRWSSSPAAAQDLTSSNWDEIWIAEPNGKRQQRVTLANFERGGVGVRTARWSPDGSLIAYATDCSMKYESYCGTIMTVQADGHRKRALGTVAGAGNELDESPAWSPDGARIAFTQLFPGKATYEVDAHLHGLTQILPRSLPALAWSPDGSRFAYWKSPSVYTGIGSIATVKTDGSDEVVLASSVPELGAHPDWSPDGKQIAFTQMRKRHAWVCVVPSTGGRVRCLTPGGEPSWSPDGRQLVYSHAHDIWVVRADGSNSRNVTRSRAWEHAPDWQPRSLSG